MELQYYSVEEAHVANPASNMARPSVAMLDLTIRVLHDAELSW
jgi:hypothetical protein